MTAHAWFLLPVAALLAGVLLLAPLGEQVLARGVVFIDLAVAQAAAAVALWSGVWLHAEDLWARQALAALGALLCAAAVAGLTRRWPAQREALIGLLYVLCAALALLGARLNPHGRDQLAELLAADVLWSTWHQAVLLGMAALAVALVGKRLQRDLWFFPIFALAASVAVPVLGLFVVFAALIAPALWRRAGASRAVAWGGALVACALGLAASWLWDAPSGACVAVALAAHGAASVLRLQPGAASTR